MHHIYYKDVPKPLQIKVFWIRDIAGFSQSFLTALGNMWPVELGRIQDLQLCEQTKQKITKQQPSPKKQTNEQTTKKRLKNMLC